MQSDPYTIINYCLTPSIEMLSISLYLSLILLCRVSVTANLCVCVHVCACCNSSEKNSWFLFVCFLFKIKQLLPERGKIVYFGIQITTRENRKKTINCRRRLKNCTRSIAADSLPHTHSCELIYPKETCHTTNNKTKRQNTQKNENKKKKRMREICFVSLFCISFLLYYYCQSNVSPLSVKDRKRVLGPVLLGPVLRANFLFIWFCPWYVWA